MFTNGQAACVYDNELQTQEMAVQVSGGSAENQLSGVLVNRIPKTGGNKFNSDNCCTFSNGSLQGNNVDAELIARGVRAPARLYRHYDINYSLGGPVLKTNCGSSSRGVTGRYNNYVAGCLQRRRQPGD